MDSSFVTVLFTLLVVNACNAEQIIVENNCQTAIYVRGEQVNTPPFSLEPGYNRYIDVTRDAQALVSAQTGCDRNGNNCDTSEGQLSMTEVRWEPNGRTWFNISMVYGYNIPVRVEPYNPAVGGNCRTASCSFSIDRDCPESSKEWNNGRVVGCKNLYFYDVTEYSRAIKRVCQDVISWFYDTTDVRYCNPGNSYLYIKYC